MKAIFKKRRHVVLPVIHVEAEAQALKNTEIAFQHDSDGVFLINHSIGSHSLLGIAAQVRRQFPNAWIGVNCLGLDPQEIFERVNENINGIWVDNAMVDERKEVQTEAERILAAREKSGWKGLYFGGVAFKYQREVTDLEGAACIAARYMDVVTTSGPGTGYAALREKITRLKAGLGDRPLGIASGITPENINDYLDTADCFLVATGVSQSFTELDPARVQSLIQKVRAYRDAA
ncbi:MAG TPA: adenine phosphoribosyltransferase [Verrucomicrobiae bacterium]|nr:adenine phosphoribosyltransferase [Verrucomicrobiae bacterium]